MRRREFIIGFAGAAAAWPLMARAQLPTPVIGILHSQSPDGYESRLRAFRQGLKEAGFVEGENATIQYAWAENQIDRLPMLAAGLVRRQVAVIVAFAPAAALAAKGATSSIPIVFGVPNDPVRLGLVTNLARPSGNITGFNFFLQEVNAKRLELLREIVPTAVRVAVLVNPSNAVDAEPALKQVEEAARAIGLQLRILNASSGAEINKAFAELARDRPDALFVTGDPMFTARRVQITHLASRHAIPAAYSVREFVEAGGLMSYGTNVPDTWRQAGVYSGRILKGAKPADLPVVQSTKFELIINHEAARLISLTMPQSLLTSADEVIE
jgi:putative tryptophan/tyrosine transport system substrate-binding protein